MSETAAVRARGLFKRYGAAVAVDGLELTIAAGECFGLLGPNGAGKTSCMRMLGCVSRPDAGSLHILGRDAGRDVRAIKRRLGVVPQDDNLDHALSARENLLLYARYFDLPARLRAERADALLASVQLAERAGAAVRTLSGGMRRRLLIARALIGDPELVLLDEPTTGLDPQARHLLWERLRALRGEARTLVLTTHYMDEAEQLCDRLVVIERGRILAAGTPAALIAEHVSPAVVEVVAAPAARAQVVAALAPQAAATEQLADRVLLFAGDAEPLAQAARRLLGPAAHVIARRSGLEDVYLKLTGRGLRD